MILVPILPHMEIGPSGRRAPLYIFNAIVTPISLTVGIVSNFGRK